VKSGISSIVELAKAGYVGKIMIPSSVDWSKQWATNPGAVIEARNRLTFSASAYEGVLKMDVKSIGAVYNQLRNAGVNLRITEIGAGGINYSTGNLDPSKNIFPKNLLEAVRLYKIPFNAWGGTAKSHQDGHQMQNPNGQLTAFGVAVLEAMRGVTK
jgi:hypothetical protein